MSEELPTDRMIDVRLARIVIREGADGQYIFLAEKKGRRGFPIVIGTGEAHEIRRVVTKSDVPPRPLTHQLTYSAIEEMGGTARGVDIVELKNNTFYAHLVIANDKGEEMARVDSRPSDAIAIALRAPRCRLRVAEHVLDQVRTDTAGPDPLQPEDAAEMDEDPPEPSGD